MTSRIPGTLLMVLCLLAVSAGGDDAAKSGSLLGTWELTGLVDGGMTAPPEALRGAKAMFTKDTFTLISPDGVEKTLYNIKVDAAKTPKAIDITATAGTFKGEAVPAIYEIVGDTLRLCQPHRPGTPRPTRFEAPKDSGLVLMTFKRSK